MTMMESISLIEIGIGQILIEIHDFGPKRREAGDYSLFSLSKKIRIRKEISVHWFATLNTLLHEYRHHQQRWGIYLATVLMIIASLIDFTMAHRILLHTFISSLVIVGVVLILHEVIEFDANRYAQNWVPDRIYLLLSDVETIDVAQNVGIESVKRTLKKLNDTISKSWPEFLAPDESVSETPTRKI